MFVPAANDERRAIYVAVRRCVLDEYYNKCGRRFADQHFDSAHTCTQSCNLWHSSKTAACVCVATGHVHCCGDLCDLNTRLSVDGDAYVCPLTNIVLSHRAVYTQTPTFDAQKRLCVHWDQTKICKLTQQQKQKRAARAARTQLRPDALRRRVICAVRNSLVSNRADNINSVKVRVLRDLPTTWCRFVACIASARTPHTITAVGFELACGAIADVIYAHMVTSRWMNSSVEATVAVYLTLMSTSWIVAGVTCVPHVPFVESRLPMPIDMALIPKVHCRAVSVGIRAFKRYMLTLSGTPVLSRVVPNSKKMHGILYRVETGGI